MILEAYDIDEDVVVRSTDEDVEFKQKSDGSWLVRYWLERSIGNKEQEVWITISNPTVKEI